MDALQPLVDIASGAISACPAPVGAVLATALPSAPPLTGAGLNAIGLVNTLIKYFLFDLFYKAAIGYMLPLKNTYGYAACIVATQVLGYVALAAQLSIPARFICYVLDYALIPYLWWDAPRRLRLIAAAFAVIAELFTEVVCMLFYSALGLTLSEQATNSPYELAARVGTLMLFGVCATVVRRALASHLEPDAERRARPVASGAERPADVRGAHPMSRPRGGSYPTFIVVQALALVIFYVAFFNNGTQEIPLPWAIGTLALIIICIASDVVAIRSLRRYLHTLRERARGDALEQELFLHTKTARALAAEGERAARFRHDARNHLQTLGLLVERGDGARARAYIEELRCKLHADAQGAEVARNDEPRETGLR